MRRLAAVLPVVAVLLLLPSSAFAEGFISSLSVSPSMVRDGQSATGTVTIVPDLGPTTVRLFSGAPSVAQVPASIVFPGGVSSADFTITTNAAAPEEIVQIMAAVGNVPRTANLSVNAATPAGPALSALSVTPVSTTGGGGVTGTIRFNGVPDGAVVQLSSSNPAVASVPSEGVVPGGSSTGLFAVTTLSVSVATPVTITARWFGITRTATLTILPGPPPAPDRVAIKSASWKKGLLKIEATSTNANAILSVFTRSGGFMFTLKNNGGGRFSDQRGWVTNPVAISVRA